MVIDAKFRSYKSRNGGLEARPVPAFPPADFPNGGAVSRSGESKGSARRMAEAKARGVEAYEQGRNEASGRRQGSRKVRSNCQKAGRSRGLVGLHDVQRPVLCSEL